MAFGSWFKKTIGKVKSFARDFVDGFRYGWNKTKSIIEKIPVVGDVARALPKFDNSNNPVLQYFGNDGYIQYIDKNNNNINNTNS